MKKNNKTTKNFLLILIVILSIVAIVKISYDMGNQHVYDLIEERVDTVKDVIQDTTGKIYKGIRKNIGIDNNDDVVKEHYYDIRGNIDGINNLDMGLGLLSQPINTGSAVDIPSRFKNQPWYPNMSLPPEVIGCGGRRQGCLGGTQIGIPTTYPPIDISDTNIAPTTIAQPGLNYNYNRLHKVGVIQKVFGNENQVYPLYSRKDPYNRNRYQYFTVLGPLNQMVPVITKSPNNELGTNESVKIQGNTGIYRTTVYENNYPRYFPTLY